MSTRSRTRKKVKAQVMHGYLCSLWCLPRTAAAYDAMVEQMTDAWDRQLGYPVRNPSGRHIRLDRVEAMLRAIGVTRP